MSMISEQVKELRAYSNASLYARENKARELLKQAADIIEALSAKLQAANDELNRWHTDHINEKIKNPFAYTSTLICHNCDHKDEYIEELEAELEELKAANMKNGGGWIPCEDRLPKDLVEVLVWFEYFRYGEYNRLFQTTGISYTFNGEWSGFVNGSSGWRELRIIAWQPLPEPYRP